MTEDSREPVHNSSDDEPRQAQQAPVDAPDADEPESGSGFAAPDTIMDRPIEAAGQQPPGDRLLVGAPPPQAAQPDQGGDPGRGYDPGFVPGFDEGRREPGGYGQQGQPGGYPGYGAQQQAPPPGYGNRPPRPGFAPHDQDQRPPYGWQSPQYQPGLPSGGQQQPPPPPQFAGQPPNQPPNWAPAPAPPAPGRGKPSTGLFVLMAVLVALVAGVVGGGIGVIASNKSDSNTGTVNLGGGKGASGDNKSRPANSVAGVAQKVLPSVVKIQVSLGNGEGGTGTGFLVKDGYILTNNHVVSEVKQGAQMQIVFNDKKTTTGTIVGTDPLSDIAVVKPATTNGLPGLQLGDSDSLAVGDEVIAIGSPLGLQGSVTTGIVSALNRPVQTSSESGTGDSSVLNAIQTDAAINPGNSGGPLLNSTGQVIGINTAIASLNSGGFGGGQQQESGSIGLGFAIPVNQVKRVSEEIINSGGKTPKHAVIGIVIDQTYTGDGVRIATAGASGNQAPVTPGGPADKAGLRPGDVITSFDGKAISQPQDLLAAIRSRAPGDKVSLTYQRSGQPTTVQITLGASS